MTLYNIELTIQEEKRKLEILKELKPNLDYYKNGNDPFAIEFSSENSITMQGQKLYFPFDCYGICILLVELRMELISPTVSALTLQRFPELIFDPEKFTGHYKLAAFVYNIIETWIMEYQITYHYNTKKQLFDEYLNICKNLALSFKEPIKISEESVINRSDSSNLQYPSVIKEDSCEPLSNEAAYLKQTVDEYLEPFKSSKAISEVDYPKILNSLTDYFEGKIIPPRQPYLVGSRNKKKLAFALGLLYRGLRKERNIAYEYLVLCKGLFQCYQDEKIDIKAINRSTLYKYFTSKPQ